MTRSIRCARIALLVWTAAVPGARRLAGQDNRYWRQTYGTEATLLNGAVIGRATDVGTIFYNPGGLADVLNPSVVLTAQVYEWEAVKAQGTDALTGEPLQFGVSSLKPAPSFFGGTIPWSALGKHRLGYSVLTRQTNDTRLAVRRSVELPEGLVQAEVLNTADLSETWVGATWAYPLNAKLSVGASLWVAVRNQLERDQTLGEGLGSSGDVAMITLVREWDYSSWRLVPKLGVTYKLPSLSLGATVTVPSLRLFGGGSALYDATGTGIDFNGDGIPDPQFASNFQKDVSSRFKTGLAVGGGAAWDPGQNTTLFLSAEWYDKVGPYSVLETQPFTGQLDGQTRTNDLVHSAKSVVNVAAGVRQRMSPSLALYLSGASDLSAADTSLAASVSKTLWDLYHVGAGAQVRIKRLDVVIGATYTFGGETIPLEGLSESPVLAGESVEFTQRGIRVLFGFQYTFSGEPSSMSGSGK